MSLQTFPFQGYDWVQSWTLFYWAWWIAWSPFVGMLVARISEENHKTICIGSTYSTKPFNFIWFTIFGGTALNMELTQSLGLSAVAVQDYSMVIFAMLEHLPLGSILTLLTVILVIIFL